MEICNLFLSGMYPETGNLITASSAGRQLAGTYGEGLCIHTGE